MILNFSRKGSEILRKVVEMINMNKSFAHVHAVKNVSFDLLEGEIHSIVGENGAGKSTLMSLLYGMHPCDSGEIIIKGEKTVDILPKEAIEMGVGMVHQEFMLVDELTVLENIILGFEPKKRSLIDFKTAKKNISFYTEKYNISVPINRRINQISVGEAQRVEIIKILSRGADIIILDEPTGVLTPQETSELFKILKNLKEAGKSIIFISHKLNEVMEISDRITIMRRGEVVDTVLRKDTSIKELSKAMVGREVFLNIQRIKTEIGEILFRAEDLWIPSVKESSKIKGMSFDVRVGEIVGVAGVDGNGQSELIEALTGLRLVEKGTIILDGVDITNKSPHFIRNEGLSHIPENRNILGLNRSTSIINNIAITSINYDRFIKNGIILDTDAMKKFADTLVKEYDVRPADSKVLVSQMSGGNAQKVVVAREVANAKKFLVAAQPTRGIDVGSIESIRKILVEAKAKGLGILLISTELDEILSLSDRIIVLSEGKIAGTMDVEEANEENLGMLMLAGRSNKSEHDIDIEGVHANE